MRGWCAAGVVEMNKSDVASLFQITAHTVYGGGGSSWLGWNDRTNGRSIASNKIQMTPPRLDRMVG
jgi:hypothetical protein